MSTQPHKITGNLKTVTTHPAHPRINEESKQRFATKILALTGVLQTTLEINELMALFAKEIRSLVAYDGLIYTFPALKINIELGDQSPHSATYNLTAASDSLGDLKFFRKHPFADDELEAIENLMAGLLYPLRNTLLYQRAVESAVIDPLTGVKNRVSMDNAVHREIELAHRHGTPISFILLDIDHFKSVNDTYGHLFGDQVLKSVAQCASNSIRDTDMIFRFGGEEFLLLLSGTDADGTQLLAERIRSNLENLHLSDDNNLRVTASLGAASLRKREDMLSIFDRMDKALYQAKDNGRNQVVVAQ